MASCINTTTQLGELVSKYDDEHWFSSERLIIPRLDRFPEMVDLARDIVTPDQASQLSFKVIEHKKAPP